jgi:hypothetical protein
MRTGKRVLLDGKDTAASTAGPKLSEMMM